MITSGLGQKLMSYSNPASDPVSLVPKLVNMSIPQLQQLAEQNQDNHDLLGAILPVLQAKKQETTKAQQPQAPQQTVASNILHQLPEESGIAQLPAPNMQHMAGGGIVAFADKGAVEGDPKAAFIEQYGPAAEYAGKRLNVAPQILLAQWGMESGWGQHMPGQFNVGNLKAGAKQVGSRGFDKTEGSNDRYVDFNNPEEFGAAYADRVARLWPDAMGAGTDVGKFNAGLKTGENGGYASDKEYLTKLSNVYAGIGGTPASATPAAGLGGTPQAAAQTGEVHTPDPSVGFNRRADRTWGEVPAEAVANIPKSTGNLFSSLGQIAMHPQDTLGNVADVGAGAFQYALPDSWTNRINSFGTPEEQALAAKQRDAASAAGQFFMNRFGSEQGIKETLATDPVGVAGDVAGLFAGGAGAARRLAALGGKRKLVQAANASVTGAEGLQAAADAKQAEAAAAAAKAQGVMEPQQLLSTEPAGALPPTEDAVMRAELNARQNARKLAGVQAVEDTAKASGLEATDAGQKAAAARTAAEADIAAAKAPTVVAPLPKKLVGLAGAAAAAKLPEIFEPNAPTKDTTPIPPEAKPFKQDIADTVKNGLGEEAKTGLGFTNDDYLRMGLGMLAGNVRGASFGQIAGEAGLGVLQNRQLQQQLATKTDLERAQAEMYRQHAAMFTARPSMAAQQNAQKNFAAWMKTSGIGATEQQQMDAMNRFTAAAMAAEQGQMASTESTALPPGANVSIAPSALAAPTAVNNANQTPA